MVAGLCRFPDVAGRPGQTSADSRRRSRLTELIIREDMANSQEKSVEKMDPPFRKTAKRRIACFVVRDRNRVEGHAPYAEFIVVRAKLLVLLHALESFFELRDQRGLACLDTAAAHHAAEQITARPLLHRCDVTPLCR